MSVIKNKRNLSDLEFYRNAIVLRKDFTILLLKDFGIKDKVRNAVAITKNMSEEDAKKFNELVQKNSQLYVLDKYPEWLINRMRDDILNLLHSLIMNITHANSIYPVFESEYYERRNLQNCAIANCEQLLQEFQYIISIIPTDINKYLRYTDMIEREIALLKGWRKSDNRILTKIQQNSEKKNETKTAIKK